MERNSFRRRQWQRHRTTTQALGAHAAEVARLIDDRTRLEDELREARAEADAAKGDQVRMARDVTMMFDELKALADKHAALHADQARLQAELEQTHAELARGRRPWWRRLMRRQVNKLQ